MALLTRPLTLREFLRLPNIEESPAWELINHQPLQKPMPTLHHSRLQKRLVAAIDAVGSQYEALPEFRCVLGDSSIVPDITVVHTTRLPTGNGPLEGAPDWIIEILSPDQSTTKLIAKIQTGLKSGTQLGWLLDSEERMIMVLSPDRPLLLLSGEDELPVLPEIALRLTANQVFDGLSM